MPFAKDLTEVGVEPGTFPPEMRALGMEAKAKVPKVYSNSPKKAKQWLR